MVKTLIAMLLGAIICYALYDQIKPVVEFCKPPAIHFAKTQIAKLQR